jgi:hypothetical protein
MQVISSTFFHARFTLTSPLWVLKDERDESERDASAAAQSSSV